MKFRKSTNNKQLFHMFFDEAHGFKSFFVILIYIYIWSVNSCPQSCYVTMSLIFWKHMFGFFFRCFQALNARSW